MVSAKIPAIKKAMIFPLRYIPKKNPLVNSNTNVGKTIRHPIKCNPMSINKDKRKLLITNSL